jgi:2'-5' RNA ligase
MPESIRTFVAVEFPEKIISWIGSIQENLRSYGLGIRWVPPGNIHLTLKFLGDIKESDVESVGRAMFASTRRFAPLSITAKGIGAFPSFKRPRVIWIGVCGPIHDLIALQRTLDDNLNAIGFPKEKRPFKGHLTLGRVKDRIDPKILLNAVQAFSGFESEPFVIDKLVLFKSDLKPSGAVYSKLMEADLIVS